LNLEMTAEIVLWLALTIPAISVCLTPLKKSLIIRDSIEPAYLNRTNLIEISLFLSNLSEGMPIRKLSTGLVPVDLLMDTWTEARCVS